MNPLNESSDLSKKEHDTQLTPQPSFTQELSMRASRPQHRKYGNMLVILQTDRILITLGSDYICFVASFVTFFLAGIYLIVQVNNSLDSTIVKIVNCLVVLVQLLSYLVVAVSNPGIVTEETLNSTEEKQDVDRICRICSFRMARGTYHCRSCDVCVRNYDHHCPWTSKCIGGSNLRRFYVFVTITPLYLIYYAVMILVAFATQTGKEALP